MDFAYKTLIAIGMLAIIAISITAISIIIGITTHHEESHGEDYGQMICDEKAQNKNYNLEYNSVESTETQVVCNKVQVEQYDGGTVRIKE